MTRDAKASDEQLRFWRRRAQEAEEADLWNAPPLPPRDMLTLLDEVERLRSVYAAAKRWRFSTAKGLGNHAELELQHAVDAAIVKEKMP